jgi:hypothetical protein
VWRLDYISCETWTVYSRHAKQLNHFHTSCLRRLLHIRWQDKVPDTEVLERAGLPSIFTILQKMQVRWTGHVIRMQDHRLPKQLLYGELSQGKRTAGGQKKRSKDSLKASLKALGLDPSTWETLALDRPAWRSNLTRGAHAAELERTAYAENKRAVRKARAASTPTTVPTHMCPTCGRAFRARIGLTSHLRTHRPRSPN